MIDMNNYKAKKNEEKKECRAGGCKYKAHVSGYCGGHQYRLERGLPLDIAPDEEHADKERDLFKTLRRTVPGKPKPGSNAEVEDAGDCMLHTGTRAHSGGGYPNVWVSSAGRSATTNRAALALSEHKDLREIDSQTMFALHKCGRGNKACCYPPHLKWGDRSQNARESHQEKKDEEAGIQPWGWALVGSK